MTANSENYENVTEGWLIRYKKPLWLTWKTFNHQSPEELTEPGKTTFKQQIKQLEQSLKESEEKYSYKPFKRKPSLIQPS